MLEKTTTCCIAGGGPAGMMLGYLLARAGVDVTVLEKHADFLRDFRGDTIHPSTMQVMDGLGLLQEFLELPHRKESAVYARFGGEELRIADFSRLSVPAPYIAFMPQWDFLDFLARKGRGFPHFRLLMSAKVESLVEKSGRCTGVIATTPEGKVTILATLVIGADGRRSDVRLASALQVEELGAPMDVLWFRMSRGPADPDRTFAQLASGRLLVMLNRVNYWQCAYVIAKGSFSELQSKGIAEFRREIGLLSPFTAGRLDELQDWEHIKLLSVAVDRMPRWWKPGLLCIGDAAHAMSPIGGVGINLAIQDAVAAANILAGPLLGKNLAETDLAAVQSRREFPTKVTQFVQVMVQNRIITPLLAGTATLKPPWVIKFLQKAPFLQTLIGRMVGMGVRPEHVTGGRG